MTNGQDPVRIGGRYELSGLLGRGGMAEVRKGTDVRLGRVVAVKRLRTDLASDPTFQARFSDAADCASRRNRAWNVASVEWSTRRILIATLRPRRRSRPRRTSAMPPRPSTLPSS